jgi:hypothetical protein
MMIGKYEWKRASAGSPLGTRAKIWVTLFLVI